MKSVRSETTMQLADEHNHVTMDTSQPNYLDVLKEAENILTKCFTDYSLEEIFLSFNGGKDCTVLLDITINVLKKLLNTTSVGEQLKVVYIQTDSPFRELEKFVNLIQKHYGLNLVTEKGDLKVTLEKILSSNNKLKACLMGTRKTDPYCDNLQFLQKTDPSWPEIVRVSPLLNWSYHQIWSYILTNQVPYCSLYDQGYTSMGSTHNTEPNPALLNHTTEPPTYLPAWKLSDGSLERAGRTKKQENAINGHIEKHGVTDSCHSLNSCQIQNGSCTTLKLDI